MIGIMRNFSVNNVLNDRIIFVRINVENYKHYETHPSLEDTSVSSPAKEILHYDLLTLINLTMLEYGLESASVNRSHTCSH